jgi:hypothetical protein
VELAAPVTLPEPVPLLVGNGGKVLPKAKAQITPTRKSTTIAQDTNF